MLIVLVAGFIGCKKEAVKESDSPQQSVDRNSLHQRASYNIGNDEDSVLTPMVLGNQMINPYLVLNMKRAYQNITGQNSTPAVTNKYVRFLPADFVKMHQLETIAETQSFELFDYPLDYEIVSEGDYYHDPSLNAGQITWQYAVVPPNFSAPSGITYEELASIHIPSNSLVEQEAERLAGLNADGDASLGGGGVARNSGDKKDKKKNTANNPPPPEPCEEGFEWDDASQTCIPSANPPDPVFTPAGRITVFDTNLPDDNHRQPVRNVRIIAQRWFKIDRTSTNNNGNFTISKSFRRRVKVKVKFKNDFCTIRPVFAVSALQSYFPVQKVIGKFSNSDIPNIDYTFGKTTLRYSNKLRRWAAATVFNAVQEHRDYAAQLGFNAAPQDMNIYISAYFSSGGSTPLFHQRLISAPPPVSWMGYFVASSNSLFDAFSAVANVDMLLGFGAYEDPLYQSDDLKETTYHEMSHASHFSTAGSSFYNELVAAEIHEINRYAIFNTEFRPYGDGNDPASPIIALGEGWAYFMGRFLADRRYQVNQVSNASPCVEQGITYSNNLPVSGLSSHLNLLEDFDPNRLNDPFHWIPQGLLYDLMDNRDDNSIQFPRVTLNDNVSGYTIQQFSTALESDVKSWSAFRTRLLTQNNNNQAAGVNTIFTFYGY